MKISTPKFYHFGFSVLMSLATANTALADDIDLYITSSTGSASVKPNVLFIIDSSGSMDAVDVPVTTTQCGDELKEYDKTYDYPGEYSDSRIYFYGPNDESPSTGGDPRGYFTTSNNQCDAIEAPLDSVGSALGHKLIRYSTWSDRWRSLRNGSNNYQIECRADAGVHGGSDGSSDVYARRGDDNPLWTNRSDRQFNSWGDIDTYTVYTGNRLNYEIITSSGEAVTTVAADGSSETCLPVTNDEERLQVVKNVANNLIQTVTGINLGIMSFVEGDREGGFVRKEVVDIDATNAGTGIDHKTELTTVVNSINHNGHTPLGETLYEAVRYLKGETPDFGAGKSVANSLAGTNYKTPITDSCQAKNNIILLSDGQPYSDFNHNNAIQNYLNTDDGVGDFLGDSAYDCPGESTNSSDSNPSRSCLVDVADFVAHNDLSALSGMQTASLYTIGFKNDLAVMEDAAAAGNGHYYQSNSYAELTETLNTIILRVLASDSTFMSPAVSVNAFNRLQHNDEIYYGMFSPDLDARWDGNIKKYTINDTGDILDADGKDAIDDVTGYFHSDAKSYWSPAPDGPKTKDGGARSQLGLRNLATDPRNVFTYTGSSAPTTAVNLNQEAHQVFDGNAAITQDMLNVSDATSRTQMINWARGYEEDGTVQSGFIGDPLHSRPTVVVYSGTSKEDQDTTVYFGTNEGFLHAIDGENGGEEFAFIPQILLPNLQEYVQDTPAKKVYGLDGEMTIWKNDLNNNGVIYSGTSLESTEGVDEGVYLYIGMRRGGNKYYALDVTDRSSPKLMWRIDGGTGDFKELGQSWSKPVVGKVKIGGVETQVLFFGGGYDPSQDAATSVQTDTIGRSLFMVDAESGKLLWSAGPDSSDDLTLSDMNNSIPAKVTIGDLSNDGLTDVVFASTMGGEVWRFDINNNNSGAGNFATGGEILDINGSSDADNRKFFAYPDVSLFAPRGQAPYFLISLGSGTRNDPLNTLVENRFYVKKEYSPFSAPVNSAGSVSYTRQTESDLYDATSNVIQTGSEDQQEAAIEVLESKSGWFIELEGEDSNGINHGGEKVLSGSITFGGKVIFTTYTPDFTVTGTGCELNLGIGRLYVLDILNGTVVLREDTPTPGIPPPPSTIIIEVPPEPPEPPCEGADCEPEPPCYSGDCEPEPPTSDSGSGETVTLVCVGTKCWDDIAGDDGQLTQSYWRSNN